MSNSNIVAAIDQGTTNTKTILVNSRGKILSTVKKQISRYYPFPGWVEQDPQDIWKSVAFSFRGALRDLKGGSDKVSAIGIADQGETIIAWDKYTGVPVYRAIVWQDRRTVGLLKEMLNRYPDLENEIRRKTGLTLDPYFSASKITWILQHVKKAEEKARAGRLLIGTTDTWIIWKMTGGRLFVTDYTTASRTMLLNINKLEWDDDLLEIFGVPADSLPNIVENGRPLCCSARETLGIETSIGNIMVDQQAALFGHACFEKGEVKVTLGTGAFLLANIGEKPAMTPGLLTTIAWVLGGSASYAFDGGLYYAGALVDYLIKNLGIMKGYKEMDRLAKSVKDSGGVFFVPAIAGLASPIWDATARGLIIGLNPSTIRAHLVRAALEGIALSIYDIIESVSRGMGGRLKVLKADGGLTNSSFMMQLLANISGVDVVVPRNTEITAYGTALIAGMATGIFPRKLEELKRFYSVKKVFKPYSVRGLEGVLKAWREAVVRSRDWATYI